LDRAGDSPADGRSEEIWLKKFNQTRRKDLLNPDDPDTQDEWRESVGRVDVLLKLLKEGNFELDPPLVVNPFGDEFVLYQ
jgi:chitosanase